MRALRIAAYPLVVGGATLFAAALLARGVPPPVAVGVASVAAAMVAIVLERVIPYRVKWQRSHGDVFVDALHLAISGALIPAVMQPLVLLVPHVQEWPADWPLGVQLALALLLGELGGYWNHRSLHRRARLWRFHALHHQAPRLYWLNALRAHPVEAAMAVTMTLLIPALLGAGPDVLALVAVFSAAHVCFQHGNIDARLGWFNELMSAGEVHRWHHSRKMDEAEGNYGNVILIWDHVFGTRLRPKGDPPEDVGAADGVDAPPGYFAQLRQPFLR